MPLDGRVEDFETQTKPDVFSLEGLIAWLETQDQAAKYNWFDIDGCVLCNYLRAVTGTKHPASTTWTNGTGGIGTTTLGENWGYYEVCETKPHTYGAALTRARALSLRVGK